MGAVGQAGSQRFLIQVVVSKDLLGILAYRHVAVAHGQQYRARLQGLGQIVIGVDVGRIALRHAQSHLVLQQVDAAALEHEIQPVGVGILVLGRVQLIHLFGRRGDKHVAGGSLGDLGLQRAGGVEGEHQVDVPMSRLVFGLDLCQRLRHGGGGKYDQFRLLRGFGAPAAGGQAQRHHQRHQQSKYLFHGQVLLSHIISLFYRKRLPVSMP